MLLAPVPAHAHAVLLEASPAPDSRWDEPPEQIVLTFNERLENRLFFIRVLNAKGNEVTKEPAVMSEDRRTISLRLPKLADGLYTISYRVISADGHPVGGSYVIVVGDADIRALENESGGAHHHHHHDLSSVSAADIIRYASRLFFFISLLLLCGWTFWRSVKRADSERLRKLQDQGVLVLLRLFLLALIIMIAFALPELLETLSGESVLSLLGTSIGISWMLSIALAIAGFYILGRSRAADLALIALLMAAKCLNGHAMAFEPRLVTAAMDWLHLAAASVWAGGLNYAIFVMRLEKEQLVPFLRTFSKAAFISMIVLAASGTATALIFLPKLEYVMYTQWGIMLMIKIALVAGVLLAGAVIRRRLKRGKGAESGWLLGIDGALMFLILVIVAVFTYSNPVPGNEPLHWHVMGDTVHVTAKITPNVPGNVNDFEVIVWLPEGQGAPKRVQLLLRHADDPDFAPIEVPLKKADVVLPYGFPGFDRYDYAAEGQYLAFPGKWETEVRVLDNTDYEYVFTHTMRVY